MVLNATTEKPSESALRYWVCTVGRFVAENAPKGSQLRKAFALANQWPDDDSEPSFELVKAAAQAWGDISEAERATVMNGWRSTFSRFPSLSDVLAEYVACSTEVVRRLGVHVRDDGRTMILPEWAASDSSTNPVTVHIAHGTSKAIAMATLAAAVKAIDENWGRAIKATLSDPIYCEPPKHTEGL